MVWGIHTTALFQDHSGFNLKSGKISGTLDNEFSGVWIWQYVQRLFKKHICKEIAEEIPDTVSRLGSENMKKISIRSHIPKKKVNDRQEKKQGVYISF